jgi:hypothetical protein
MKRKSLSNVSLVIPALHQNKSTLISKIVPNCTWHYLYSIYCTRAIITRGLYIFYPLFGSQKRFFKEVFSENSVISIQERFLIKSGL